MKWAYQAFDMQGNTRSGTVEAAAEAEAVELLRREGLFASSIRRSNKGATASGGRRLRLGGGGRLRHLTVTLRQMAVLVSTGTPVVEALHAIERQSADVRWRAVLSDVRARVEEGSTLADAMAAHPRSFGSICQSLVAAGEAGGKLEAMLERLAELTRQQQRVRSSLIGAMVYPTLLIGVSAIVLTMMVMFVLPRFAEMFETLDMPLPASTSFLLALSDWLREWWWCVPIALGGATAGLWRWALTPRGRRRLDALIVTAPLVGPMARSLSVAQMSRLLGVLMQARVPLLEAIDLTHDAMRNTMYREMLDAARIAVSKGEPLSASFADSPLVPDSISEAARSGERSGSLGRVLGDVADFIDEDNEVLVRSLTSIIEPVILIVLGVMVAIIALSMFLPLFDMTAAATGGAA